MKPLTNDQLRESPNRPSSACVINNTGHALQQGSPVSVNLRTKQALPFHPFTMNDYTLGVCADGALPGESAEVFLTHGQGVTKCPC